MGNREEKEYVGDTQSIAIVVKRLMVALGGMVQGQPEMATEANPSVQTWWLASWEAAPPVGKSALYVRKGFLTDDRARGCESRWN